MHRATAGRQLQHHVGVGVAEAVRVVDDEQRRRATRRGQQQPPQCADDLVPPDRPHRRGRRACRQRAEHRTRRRADALHQRRVVGEQGFGGGGGRRVRARLRPGVDADYRPAVLARDGSDLPAQRRLADAGFTAHRDPAGRPVVRRGEPRRDLRQLVVPADQRRRGRTQRAGARVEQRLGGRVGPHAQRALQRIAQAEVPAQRRGPVARGQCAAHQLAVRRLVGGLGLRDAFPLRAGAQQVQVQQVQPAARGFGPWLVARLGQQFASIGRGGGDAGLGVAAGQRLPGLPREAQRVDLDAHRRAERHAAAVQPHRVGVAQRPARVVRGLAQVRGTRVGTELRPQRVDDLLAQQAVAVGERQQLHQLRGAQAGPVVDGDAVDARAEAAEQSDLEPCGRDGHAVGPRRRERRSVRRVRCGDKRGPGNVSGTPRADAADHRPRRGPSPRRPRWMSVD